MNSLFALLILLHSAVVSITAQCPIAGCYPSRCFCVNDFAASIRKDPVIKHVKSPLKLSNKGCLANGNNIVCPVDREEAITSKTGCVTLTYTDKESTWWKCKDINRTISLPIIDIEGNVIASDGYSLVAYTSNGTVVPPPVTLYPNTGQIVDMIFTDNQLFEMIYKCGLIVAYDTDGIAWASIWINNTDTTNGTFVPLATPAIIGQRMYLLTGFWPTNASSGRSDSNANTFMIRLYAIDSTTFAVRRLRIVWYYETVLEGYLPAIEQSYKSCSYHPPTTHPAPDHITLDDSSTDDNTVAQVTVLGKTVIFTLNYETITNATLHATVSVDDHNTSYHENCLSQSTDNAVAISLATFQAGRDFSKFTSDYVVKAIEETDSHTQLMIYKRQDICKRPLHSYSLSTLLFNDQKHDVTLTTDLLTIVTANNSMLYIMLGALYDGNGYVVALHIADKDLEASIIWKDSTPDKLPPVGQISALGNNIVFSTNNDLIIYTMS